MTNLEIILNKGKAIGEPFEFTTKSQVLLTIQRWGVQGVWEAEITLSTEKVIHKQARAEYGLKYEDLYNAVYTRHEHIINADPSVKCLWVRKGLKSVQYILESDVREALNDLELV